MSPATQAARIARRWVRLHPELAHALARAQALIGGVERVSRDAYRVEGGEGVYLVEIDRRAGTSRCECQAWKYSRGARPRCKHTLACALLERVEADTQQAA